MAAAEREGERTQGYGDREGCGFEEKVARAVNGLSYLLILNLLAC